MDKPVNRTAQKQVLEGLRSVYPNWRGYYDIPGLPDDFKPEADLTYLSEHGLVELKASWDRGMITNPATAKITAKGIDFIEDDGGLSSILGVVTIKLHDETVKQLLASRIQQSSLPDEEKRGYLAKLRDLPAEATKTLVEKLIERGIDAGPGAVDFLVRFFGG